MRRIDRIRAQRNRQPLGRWDPQWMLETLSLVLMGILILAFTISRVWHSTHWSVR